MFTADLHIHTNQSDGIYAPREVVSWAKKKHVTTIAITDHDTTAGIAEAIHCGEIEGVEVIPGIEFSTIYRDEEIHILGYFLDYHAERLLKKLKEIQDSRERRVYQMAQKLQDIGIAILPEDIFKYADGASVGRPHVARALIEKGAASTIKEAFDLYLLKGRPGYVERYRLQTADAICLIQDLRGLAVIAHPGLIGRKESIGEIIDVGVDGIEVYHPKHDAETTRTMLEIAQTHRLLMTGGSDCHGPMEGTALASIGSIPYPYCYLEELKNAAQNRRN